MKSITKNEYLRNFFEKRKNVCKKYEIGEKGKNFIPKLSSSVDSAYINEIIE